MKILSVVGARPNFMKVAPIIAAIDQHNRQVRTGSGAAKARHEIAHVLVHTGQHYDSAMSDSFFLDLGLPKPDVHLGVGSGSQAAQTAEIMKKFEEVLLREQPNVMVVVGDVNSTIACALVASKLTYDANRRPLIAHVEAGLRSFDRTMPEEVNRVLTDHLSDFLFVTEDSGLRNLAREGVTTDKVHFVGNTMIDSLIACRDRAASSNVLHSLGLRGDGNDLGPEGETKAYALLTLHRPANVDQREPFVNILAGLEDLARTHPIVFPTHPRTRKRIAEFGLNGSIESRVRMVEPLGYLDFVCLMMNAKIVVTDSGGIQEETTCLGVPCVTVRENTERPVTIESGTNVLAGVRSEGIRSAIGRQLEARATGTSPKLWDGCSAARIVDILVSSVTTAA